MQSRTAGAESGAAKRRSVLGLGLVGELALAFVLYVLSVGTQQYCTGEYGDQIDVGSPRYDACRNGDVRLVLVILAFLTIPAAAVVVLRRRASFGTSVMWVLAATVCGVALLALWFMSIKVTSAT